MGRENGRLCASVSNMMSTCNDTPIHQYPNRYLSRQKDINSKMLVLVLTEIYYQ